MTDGWPDLSGLASERVDRADGPAGRALAVLSPCGTYRYLLVRRWAEGPRLLAVLLNPSTADAVRDDPTLTRLLRRAGNAGYGALAVVNLFAYRSPAPKALLTAADAEGPWNRQAQAVALDWADAVLLGWGAWPGARTAGAAFCGRARQTGKPLLHLGMTRGGAPRHPLYLSGTAGFIPLGDRWPVPG